MDRLEETRARVEAATPGPWEQAWSAQREPVCQFNDPQYSTPFRIYGDTEKVGTADYVPNDHEANALFIANAREDVPYLLDQLAAVTAERDALKAELDAHCVEFPYVQNYLDDLRLYVMCDEAELDEKALEYRATLLKVIQGTVCAGCAMTARADKAETEVARLQQRIDATSFWQGLFDGMKDAGEFDSDSVRAELEDYHMILENVGKVYCHITDGAISKPNALADVVIAVADDVDTELVRDFEHQLAQQTARAERAEAALDGLLQLVHRHMSLELLDTDKRISSARMVMRNIREYKQASGALGGGQMRERPIIFNAEMVRAILDGRKTMTRRPVKPQPYQQCVRVEAHGDEFIQVLTDGKGQEFRLGNIHERLHCPYAVGDLLWVRETWLPDPPCDGTWDHYGDEFHLADIPDQFRNPENTLYRADDKWANAPYRWRPSIHMPRWASRLTLGVTGIRAERVQDIGTSDVYAEGFTQEYCAKAERKGWEAHEDCEEAFRNLWNSIYAKWNRRVTVDSEGQKTVLFECYPWCEEDIPPIPANATHPENYHAYPNPFVWVIEFERVEGDK